MSTFSKEQKEYLKKIKKEKLAVKLCQLSILVIFLIIWQFLANFEIISTFLYSSPLSIINTIKNLITSNQLFINLFVTCYEIFISFTLSIIIGLTVATIFWWNSFIAKIFEPYLTILNSLPKVALGPLIIIWVGASMNSIILMALLISVFVTIINIYNGFKNTENDYIKLLKSFNATKTQIYLNLILPSNFNNIIEAIKINISMSLIGVIMGELLVSKQGIGYLIMYGSQVFNINLILTAVVLLGIISYLMYIIVDKMNNKT